MYSFQHSNLKIQSGRVKVARKIATGLHKAFQKNSENYHLPFNFHKENLGIPREQMPVIGPDDIGEFIKRLRLGLLSIDKPERTSDYLVSGDCDRDCVKVYEKDVAAVMLKASQKDINAERVQGMVDNYRKGVFDMSGSPVLVSEDGYLIDGHHRWAAMHIIESLTGEKMLLNCYVVGLKVRDLLMVANAFTDACGIQRKTL